MFFYVNTRLLTKPQFTTNISTRSIIWRVESTGGALNAPPGNLVAWRAS